MRDVTIDVTEEVEHLAETLELAGEDCDRALEADWSRETLALFLADVRRRVAAARDEAFTLRLLVDRGEDPR